MSHIKDMDMMKDTSTTQVSKELQLNRGNWYVQTYKRTAQCRRGQHIHCRTKEGVAWGPSPEKKWERRERKDWEGISWHQMSFSAGQHAGSMRKHLLANDTRPQAISGAETRQKCELKEREPDAADGQQCRKWDNKRCEHSCPTQEETFISPKAPNASQPPALCSLLLLPGVPFLFPFPDSVSSSSSFLEYNSPQPSSTPPNC